MKLQSLLIPTRSKKEKAIDHDLQNLSREIESVAETVGGGSDYTETIVNVSNAQIYTLSSSPIVLLPTPDANQYYDFYGYIEVTSDGNFNAVNGMAQTYTVIRDDNYDFYNTYDTLMFYGNHALHFSSVPSTDPYRPVSVGSAIYLTGETDWTDGIGSFRVKIYSKTITFGA
jgi:hypothetical protein